MARSRLACLKHIALALMALVFLVCAVEVGLRIYVAGRAGRLPADAPEKSLIVRSWLTHHGLKPLASAACRNPDNGAPVVLSTNSFALRGPEPAVPKPPDVFRVLCLGDETTLAADYDRAQTFCGRLEQLLQPHCRLKLEVVNAGVPGYCPLLSYLHVRHSLLGLQPDLIVLNFDMNDVWDDYRYRRHANISAAGEPLACSNPAFVKSAQALRRSVADELIVIRWGRSQMGAIPLADARPEDRRRIDSSASRYAWLADNPPDWSIHVSQALSPLERLNELAKRNLSRLAVAACPAPWQVSAEASSGTGVRRAAGVDEATVFRSRVPFDTLSAYTGEHGIAFHDASPAFQTAERPETLYLKNAARLSERGHKLYAIELARFIYRIVPDVWKAIDSPEEPTSPSPNVRSASR